MSDRGAVTPRVIAVASPVRVIAVPTSWFVGAAAAAWLGAGWWSLATVSGVAPAAALATLVLIAVALPRSPSLRAGRAVLLGLAVAAFVGTLASARVAGRIAHLDAATELSIGAEATIASDPMWRGHALRVDVEVAGRSWRVWARGPVAYRLEDALAGERWWMTGRSKPADEEARWWMWPQGLSGSLSVDEAVRRSSGAVPQRVANGLRATIERSAQTLSVRDRALLTGFVYGDDRAQPPEVADDFRATGLTHLSAVSGSNVALVLTLLRPLLDRVRGPWRLIAVVAVLAQFVVLTRAEPSVIRAAVLAGLATAGSVFGRPVAGVRLLAAAVIVILLADPLLARSVGFQLSVAATAGIAVLRPMILGRLAGPAVVSELVATTIAAQLGVLPVQLAVFGGLPLVSIPSNVLAGPVAGPAMVWGLVAGLLGGVLGEPLAGMLHLPSRVLLGWVAAVARVGAAADWPELEPDELPATILVAMVAVAVRRLVRGVTGVVARVGRMFFALAFGCAAMAIASGSADGPVSGRSAADDPIQIVVDDGVTVVIVDRPLPENALEWLRRSGTRGIDVLVSRSAARDAAELVRVLDSRLHIARVVAPGPLTGAGREIEVITEEVMVGGVAVRRDGSRLITDRGG